MWLLQHKNTHKKITLWLKIASFCLFFHFIILFWIFCLYQENKFMHIFSIDKKTNYSSPIFFVPVGISAPIQTAPQKTASITQKRALSKDPHYSKTTIDPVQKDDKNQEKKTTIPDINKKLISEKTDIKKNCTKLEPPLTNNKNKHESTYNPQISHNYREVEALRRGAQLQKELVNQWHPPIGTRPDCTCDISFFVNRQGKIENLKTTKSSQAIMFDISARQALFSMKMPQWTYGKSLTITFKP